MDLHPATLRASSATQAAALDPRPFGSIDWGHFSNPQTSDFVTGTNSLITERSNSQIGVRQGFLGPAPTATLLLGQHPTEHEPLRNNLNLSEQRHLQVSQPLLRGFGLAVNRRNIVVAKRNQQVTDLASSSRSSPWSYACSSSTGIWSACGRTWTPLQALELAGKLYDDNKAVSRSARLRRSKSSAPRPKPPRARRT
ncbi:MAG: hypothetical protein R2748_13390 [Bryobacterales bacterium]